MDKKYDIVVYGATGFTGKLVCEYLDSHYQINNVKWAIAGRNIDKLNKVANSLSNIDIIQATSEVSDSLDKMCSQTKLILTTVGPYDLYGELLLKSCIENKTNYLDLTGEPQFVNRMIKQYSETAKDRGVVIINCCGFESIIPDVGTLFTVKKMNSKKIQVNYFLQTYGTISGGTWASFLNSIVIKKSMPKVTPSENKSYKTKKFYFDKNLNKWAVIFPVIDKQIVMRSSKTNSNYGDVFNFNEYVLGKSYMKLLILICTIGFITFIARFQIIRKWLMSLKPSGSGPDEKQRDKNWFKATIVAKGGSEKVTTVIKGKDPGYGETSKFISEIALCITLEKDKLQKCSGFLTPVECTGDLLIKRLRKAGINITSS